MTELTIPLPPSFLLAIGPVLVLAAASGLVVLIMMPPMQAKRDALGAMQGRLGLRILHPALFVGAATLWGMLFLLLAIGLVFSIIETIWAVLPLPEDVWSWRFSLVKLTALTTVLAAIIALPFTLIRLKLSHDQAEHAKKVLYNDKMNTAVADLYAQRQITEWKDKTANNGWQDDITRRNGAIDRLKGLTDERPDLLERVDRLLSVYLRELTREYPAETPPQGVTPEEKQEWAKALKPPRSDMEYAAQTLGRLNRTLLGKNNEQYADLQDMNLQGYNLEGLDFKKANLKNAKLRGANLYGAKLQAADLRDARLRSAQLRKANLRRAKLGKAKLPGAYLNEAKLEKADLSEAQFLAADLRSARLQGARLFGTKLRGANLDGAQLCGAALRSTDLTSTPAIADHLDGMFGDNTVTLPEGVKRPDRFNEEYESQEAFETAWRAFQRSIGQDPDAPE